MRWSVFLGLLLAINGGAWLLDAILSVSGVDGTVRAWIAVPGVTVSVVVLLAVDHMLMIERRRRLLDPAHRWDGGDHHAPVTDERTRGVRAIGAGQGPPDDVPGARDL